MLAAFDALTLLKSALIPLVILVASLCARRFGHGFAGVMAGFPLIAAPVMLMLILQHGADRIALIAGATLASLPTSVAFLVTFAWLAKRCRWWTCLAGATLAFCIVGVVVVAIAPWAQTSAAAAVGLRYLLPLCSPLLGYALMPRATNLPAAAPSGVLPRIPPGELGVRMLVGLVTGLALIAGAGEVSPAVSGLLLTWPVTGSVLPAFTLALHGRVATVQLLRGFATGLNGFALFFLILGVAIGHGAAPLPSFLAALIAPMLLAGALHRQRLRSMKRSTDSTAAPL